MRERKRLFIYPQGHGDFGGRNLCIKDWKVRLHRREQHRSPGGQVRCNHEPLERQVYMTESPLTSFELPELHNALLP